MTIRFSRAQSIEYDRACSQDLGLPSIVLMTHAAVECAALIRAMLSSRTTNIIALCGSGNNGGDGYAIVRTLQSWGFRARAIEVAPPRIGSDARIMRDAAAALGRVDPFESINALGRGDEPTILIDAIFGTGLTRAPVGDELAAIEWINAQGLRGSRIVAIDIPSGLDCDTGQPLGCATSAVRATQTLTMVCEKAGFASDSARHYLGAVSIVPIGGAPVTQEHQTVE